MAFKVELSHHEGYCSGAENEYTTWVETPKLLGEGDIEQERLKIERLLEQRVTEEMGSGYCAVSEESESHGLQRHDFRVTYLKPA
jgi:hypothetical protein